MASGEGSSAVSRKGKGRVIMNTWIHITQDFSSEDNATLAIDALAKELGGLQIRSPLVQQVSRDTWVAGIDVTPETSSFAAGFLSGWRMSEMA